MPPILCAISSRSLADAEDMEQKSAKDARERRQFVFWTRPEGRQEAAEGAEVAK